MSARAQVPPAILLTAVGTFVFRESLGPREVAGLILAIASLYLLTRFA